MTANPTLPLPRGLRHPSWYLPLLLPVIPALTPFLREVPAATGHSELLILLFALGATVAFGGGAAVDWLGHDARKEVGQLRTVWLASIFLCQVPLLFGREFGDLAGMLFFASSALLAAIPFGAEFQQRTLAGLLSQPVPRERWWNLKTGLLAAALGLHWLLFLVAGFATGQTVTPTLAAALFAVAVLAWSTTPWWTLRTRGLLAGLVLSVAVPILVQGGSLVLLDVMDRYLGLIDSGRAESWMTTALVAVILPAYVIFARIDGGRLWRRIEAPDAQSAEGFPLSIPGSVSFTDRTSVAPTRRSAIFRLVTKELHLQTVSLLGALATALLAAVVILTRGLLVVGDYTFGALMLAAVATILLAGAVPIAEERRLGTLDAQLLLPASRALQWWVKLTLALGIVGFTAGATLLAVPVQSEEAATLPLIVGGVLVLTLFAPALLASSASTNSVRALVTGLGLAAVTVSLIGFSMTMIPRFEAQATEEWRDRALRQPEQLRAEAQQLSAPEVREMEEVNAYHGVPLQMAVLSGTAGAGAAIPALLALFFARRNFTRSQTTRGRAAWQFTACVSVTAACSAAMLLIGHRNAQAEQRYRALADVRRSLAWEATLTPAERLLWQRHRAGPDPFTDTVRIQPRPGADPGTAIMHTTLPLSPWDRRWILVAGQIGDDLRQALEQDAAKNPVPPTLELPEDEVLPPGVLRRGNTTRAVRRFGVGNPPGDELPPGVRLRQSLVSPARPPEPPTPPVPQRPTP